jgi:hypothetical protein
MFSFIANFFNSIIFELIIPGISVGVLLIIVSTFIPPLFVAYKVPAQVLGLVLIVFFVFQAGRYDEVNKQEKAVLVNNVKVAEKAVASEKINTISTIQYVDRIKIVKEIQKVNTNVYVDKKADIQCPIDLNTSVHIAKLLNSAIGGTVPNSPSDIGSKAK